MRVKRPWRKPPASKLNRDLRLQTIHPEKGQSVFTSYGLLKPSAEHTSANLREISAWRRLAPMGVPADANPRSCGKWPSGMMPG